MEKSIVKRWAKALRSGKYKQAKKTLKGLDGSMCCLGVLCDITQEETGGKWDHRKFGNSEEYGAYFLPPFVSDKLGIGDSGKLKKDYKRKITPDNNNQYSDHLSTLNDSGHTFEEIADIIEENF